MVQHEQNAVYVSAMTEIVRFRRKLRTVVRSLKILACFLTRVGGIINEHQGMVCCGKYNYNFKQPSLEYLQVEDQSTSIFQQHISIPYL